MPETNFFWDPLADNILQERDETGAVTAGYSTLPWHASRLPASADFAPSI